MARIRHIPGLTPISRGARMTMTTMPLVDQAHAAPEARLLRSDVLLPPAIILLVFAMVVIAVAGFATISGQQQGLGALRQQSEALRAAADVVATADADQRAPGRPGTGENTGCRIQVDHMLRHIERPLQDRHLHAQRLYGERHSHGLH